MFGVLDDTGTLQYGQVFVQYSTKIHEAGEMKKVLKGNWKEI